MSKYLKTKEGSIESAVLKSVNTPKEEPKKVNVEFKPSSYFGVKEGTVSDAASKAINEKVDNAYAIGMSQAMKKTGDNPPLKKSTITKAHDIAKAIKKDEVKEEVSQKDVDKFHTKLDKLVHKSFGHSSDEKKKEVKEEENEYKKLFKKELEKSGKSLSSMSDSEKKDFFNKIDTMYKGKNEELSAAQKKLPPALQKAIAKKMASKKEDVKETHTYHKDKQNKKQTKADGEKEIVDPDPKLKAEDVIRGLWEKAVDDQKEVEKKDEDDKSKEKLKIKLAKEKDTDSLERQLNALQGQNNVLKQKLENEKNKAIKPEPNPETGEVPLTVGIAYKHLRDKMKKEGNNPEVVNDEDSKEKEKKLKGKADTGSPKTPIDTEPKVDYKN